MRNSIHKLIDDLKDANSNTRGKGRYCRTEELMNQRDLMMQKNAEILDSINYAKRLQQAILPKDKRLNELLGEHFILYKPKDDIVSGDFYWAANKRRPSLGSRKLIALGHGVPGAMVSGSGCQWIISLFKKKMDCQNLKNVRQAN